MCSFEDTPQYVTSPVNLNTCLGSTAGKLFVRGTNAVSTPSKDMFRYIIYYPVLGAASLLAKVQGCGVEVAWLADDGSNSGATVRWGCMI